MENKMANIIVEYYENALLAEAAYADFSGAKDQVMSEWVNSGCKSTISPFKYS